MFSRTNTVNKTILAGNVSSRELGYCEAVVKSYSDVGMGSSTITNISKISGSLNKTIFKQALQMLVHKQPLLRAKLLPAKNENDQLVVFEKLMVLPVKYEKLDHVQDLAEYLRKEISNYIHSNNEPLWRVVLLQSKFESVIIFIFHHSISDGVSIKFLVEDLIRFCNQQKANLVKEVTSLSFLPSIESIVNFSQPDNETTFFTNDLILPKHKQQSLMKDRVCKNIFYQISNELMNVLHAVCKKNAITITSLLNAALALSIDYSQYEQKKLMFITPVSMRGMCEPPVPLDYLVDCVSSVTVTVSVSNDILSVASEYHKKSAEQRNNKLFNMKKTYSKADVENKSKYINMLTENASISPLSTMVTNIGVATPEENFEFFKVTESYGTTFQPMGGALLFLHASTLNGQLLCCFSYAEPILNLEEAKAILQRFTHNLAKVAGLEEKIVLNMDDVNAKVYINNTNLISVIQQGDLLVLQKLLSEKSKILEKDVDGNSGLLIAASFGHLDIVRWLIEQRLSSIEEENNVGKDALILSAENNHLYIVEWLLTEGVVNACGFTLKGISYLDYAFISENNRFNKDGKNLFAEVLLDFGAGINANLTNLPTIDMSHKVVIGMKIQGKPVNREMPGFTQAITTVAELKAALSFGGQLNVTALKRACYAWLKKEPNDNQALEVKNILSEVAKLPRHGFYFTTNSHIPENDNKEQLLQGAPTTGVTHCKP